MTARLWKAMREHFAAFRFVQYNGRASPWVFHHLTTKRTHKAGRRLQSLRSAFNAAKRRASCPAGFVRHDLRHRRVTTWLAEGKSPVLVKEALGHQDLKTTMSYMHFIREHLKGLVDEPDREALRALA